MSNERSPRESVAASINENRSKRLPEYLRGLLSGALIIPVLLMGKDRIKKLSPDRQTGIAIGLWGTGLSVAAWIANPVLGFGVTSLMVFFAQMGALNRIKYKNNSTAA